MPFAFMRGCSDRYGDRFTVSLSQRLPPVVFFSNPKALQVIMTSDDSELFDSPGDLNTLLEPLLGTQSLMGPFMENGCVLTGSLFETLLRR